MLKILSEVMGATPYAKNVIDVPVPIKNVVEETKREAIRCCSKLSLKISEIRDPKGIQYECLLGQGIFRKGRQELSG